MLNIPYSGSGILTQAISLNKSRMKEVLSFYGIPTPQYQLYTNLRSKLDTSLNFPLIVKPDAEGSSVGITDEAVVNDTQALQRQISHIRKNYSQRVLVEEFCSGREFTVGLLGNGKPRVLPIVEVNFDHLPENLNWIDSYEAKWIYDNPENPVDPLFCPADVTPGLKRSLEGIARRTYSVLGCVDLCRIDIRLDSKGIPNVLDVNALPGLIPDIKDNSRFPRAWYATGRTYDELILEILNSSLKRYNLQIK
jgi:D-alanine-D-alanine ligase